MKRDDLIKHLRLHGCAFCGKVATTLFTSTASRKRLQLFPGIGRLMKVSAEKYVGT